MLANSLSRNSLLVFHSIVTSWMVFSTTLWISNHIVNGTSRPLFLGHWNKHIYISHNWQANLLFPIALYWTTNGLRAVGLLTWTWHDHYHHIRNRQGRMPVVRGTDNVLFYLSRWSPFFIFYSTVVDRHMRLLDPIIWIDLRWFCFWLNRNETGEPAHLYLCGIHTCRCIAMAKRKKKNHSSHPIYLQPR